jgi:nicotinamidase/pyrazinamidase
MKGFKMKKVHLLIIDPQKDFCEPTGALYVKGAENDMARLAKFIKTEGAKISQIHVTLDSHHLVDVAHPIFWRNSQGEHPNPFTIISVDDVKNGVWLPTITSLTQRMITYTEELASSGRYPLCIWPPHCLIGSAGHAVAPDLYKSLLEWETRPAIVNYVTKGSNIFTEHYSAVKSEVEDPADSSTMINARLIEILEHTADTVLIAGEAGSHCVANTVRDIANEFKNDKYIQKLILLTDAISPVTGFEKMQSDFITDMTKRGMQTATTSDLKL